jgi:hypothetical protein
MRELIELWSKVLGVPPSERQFLIWMESHPADVVRNGILKAAMKNQQMGGTMSEDHKIRFASKVMLTASAQRKANALNREKLQAEMSGGVSHE